ncbi:MAG: extracellular solute-binding protein [Clostridiales bacterium]|nr:extracellular solute-binding protein [Clostridiales bacterium]MDY4199942.1 extracellular solute-binding protein [Candidatus Fimadaptatus sp.]
MKKKAIALSLAMATMFSSSALAYTVSEPGQLPVVDEVVEYTICAPDTTYVCDLNENTLTPWIQEKTNIKINFEEIPDTEWDTKVNLLIASDELPDAFIYGSFSAAELADYGSQGVFLALNDIIEEHGYYVKQVFDQQEALPGAYTALDGNIYTLPDINECYHCFYSMRAWINQQWLTNLGLEYPNTVDEFVNVLRAFKEQDANGNGDPNDEIPFSGNATSWNSTIYPFLLNSFLHYDTSNLSVKEDGTVIFTPIQPEFKEGLQWIASLIDEGLIEKEALTQTEEQLKTKGSNLDIALLGGFTSAVWWSGVGSDNGEGSRCREYSGLSPLEGPNGVRISPWAGTGFNMGNSVITTACEDPVPLFKMLDYMLSDEATLRSQVGELGVDYNEPDEGAPGINGKPALYAKIPTSTNSGGTTGDESTTAMQNVFPSNRTSDFRLGEQADYSDPETQWQQEPRLYNESATYFAPYADEHMMYPGAVNLTAEESEKINFMKTQINDYVKENIVLFLAGEKSFDTDWDSFIAEFDNLKLDEYMELRQMAYTRQYGSAE